MCIGPKTKGGNKGLDGAYNCATSYNHKDEAELGLERFMENDEREAIRSDPFKYLENQNQDTVCFLLLFWLI